MENSARIFFFFTSKVGANKHFLLSIVTDSSLCWNSLNLLSVSSALVHRSDREIPFFFSQFQINFHFAWQSLVSIWFNFWYDEWMRMMWMTAMQLFDSTREKKGLKWHLKLFISCMERAMECIFSFLSTKLFHSIATKLADFNKAIARLCDDNNGRGCNERETSNKLCECRQPIHFWLGLNRYAVNVWCPIFLSQWNRHYRIFEYSKSESRITRMVQTLLSTLTL